MKTLVGNQKCFGFILVSFLILLFGTLETSYGVNVGEPRTVRLFYFLPNDRPYRAEVVAAMKTGILEVQSFFAEQMAAHGYGNMTFNIETDAQGIPIVHRVNGDYSDNHYKNRGRPENEISRAFDTSSIVQLVVMGTSRSSGGRGVGIKQRGQAIVDGGWSWNTAAHELGHAFGLKHDFRDDAYIMSYGSGRGTLSAGAAHFLAVNPYFNNSVPLQGGSLPSVALVSSTQYSYGATSVPVQVRVRDGDGLQQVALFVDTPEGGGFARPSGFKEVVAFRNLSGQTDTTVTFNYDGNTPFDDGDMSLLNQLRHTIYVSAVDRQGNRIDSPASWTLQAVNIPELNVPLRDRSPRVADSIYNVVRLFHDRSVSSYDHITEAHLADIGTMFVNNIDTNNRLRSDDFDGLTSLETLELRFESGYSENTLLPAGIFKGLTSLSNLKIKWYDTYGSDPSLLPFLPLTVGLEKVGEGQFKAIVPTGAPFNMDLPLIVVNGNINGGAERVTIPAGSVESDVLTVTRTPGTTAAVVVDLERTVPSPPGSGYVFYKSSFHLEMFSPLAGAPTPVAERTPQVLDAIVGVVPEIEHIHHDRDLRYMVNGKFIDKKYNMGHYVSEAHLKAITSLDVSGGSNLDLGGNWFSLHGDITELKLGDFDGMSNLTSLRLDDNELSSLPDGIFDKLTNLETLNLSFNQLSSLPDDIFDNLTNLTTLSLVKNQLSSLPDDIFDNLTNLTTLNLSGNQLSSLPEGLFDNLTNLTFLNLLDNPLRPLPEGYFDNLPNLETLHLPRTITPTPLPEAGEVTPVTDRTPQVRDAIVAAAGVNSAADVTAVHLAAIMELDMQEANIAALKQGDFDNLTNLELLALNGTFSSFPDGIFDNLTNLETLGLSGTFSSLPDGIFDNLPNLTGLVIISPQLSSLPAGIFDNLTNLQRFGIGNTQLRSLPDGIFDNFTNVWFMSLSNNQLSSLPRGIFDKATMILDLSNNQLSSLPDGIFEGIFDEPPDLTGVEIFDVPLGPIPEDRLAELGEYTTVNLTGNLVDPLPLTISLERVADGQFKAVAPAGAPYELVLPIRVASGNINGGAENITIPVGSVESDTFTVTRTPGTTFAITVDIETLPGLPKEHSGYALVKSADLPLVFTEFGGILPVSARTPEVRDAIVDAIPGVSDYRNVTEAHLAAITRIQFALGNSVKAGDFDGLTGLTEFGLFTGQLTSIPAGLFNDLSNVTLLEFISEGLTTLPVGPFDSFTNLTSMTLYIPQLASLPDGIFDSLTNLTEFELVLSQLTSLPDGIFDRLTNLTAFGLGCEQLTSLPDGIFDQLTNLTGLSFHTGQLTSLPDNLFNQLTNLTGLSLSGSHLTSLLDSIKWPTTLTSLGLYSTQLSTLPEGVFAGLPSLTTLNLNNNNLTSFPPDIFSELPTLTKLSIRDNQLSTLPDGLFSGLSSLTLLDLSGNAVDPLPLNVSLEKVGAGQFKAVAPAGAPFAIVLPLTVTNGSINGGATTVTIPAGSVESDTLTVTLTPGTTFAVTADIDTVPGLPANHSGYTLAKSVDLPLMFTEFGGTVFTPVSERTPQVRDAIVAAVPGVNSASDVTAAHLAAITGSFILDQKGITKLKAGDFSGLTSVTHLYLRSNNLTTLPAGVFDGLTSTTFIGLSKNQLSTLPAGVFDGLTSLLILDLENNQFSTLPVGIFDGLNNLQRIWLRGNRFSTLPAGIFDGLNALTWLYLGNNAVDPLPLTVSLEKVNSGQFKVVAPTGAPFDIVVPLNVKYGNITGGTTSITIPKGSVESEVLTVTRTSGTTFAVTADIDTVPGLPANHSGYTLVKSDDLPLVFTELGGTVFTPVSERTRQVRDAIVAAVPGVNSASDVTEAHLAAITLLDFGFTSIRSLTASDFDGLTALEWLNLPNDTQLSTLPAGIFDDLTALTSLNLSRIQLSTLPAGIFDKLANLKKLYLSSNELSSFPDGIFDNLTNLTELHLDDNQLSTLPAGIFDKLTALTKLELDENQLSTLPAGIFDKLANLTFLNLYGNQLSSLPADIFDTLTALTSLYLSENQLSSLPAGIFDGLTALEALTLDRNPVDPLPLIVSLEQVEESQFKAVAPTGAPYDIVLPLTITNGSISSGVTTITIPKGSVESETLTVTRTPGENLIAIVNIGTLPSIPTEVRYGHPLHQGYTLVKSEDLPLIFNAVSTPSETTLMAIKGTITEDGTPAEAGLEVTVTIGSTTQTAVSEAGGVYSVIFLNTQGVVATSGDTVTVQVLNPNTGEDTERTISLSSEQIIAKKATIDLQFSPSGREYLLSVPEGISLIHVPLKVTAVDGATKTLESVGDLYDALGGAVTVSLLITHDPQAQRWVGYFGSGDRGSSADKVLTDDLGIIAVLTAPASVSLSGDALGTNGRSSITVHPGINLVGVPLKDSRITRVTDLFALEGIKDNVSLTLVSDNGEIKLVEQAGDSGDIPVTGGQSFILVAKSAATVEISGTGWSNVPDPAVAPSTALTGIEVRDTTPVLAMSGSILPPAGGASLPRLGVTDFSVTVKNLSTGKVDTSVTDNDGVTYQFTFVDIETGRAAQVGDILEITAQSPNPFVGVQPLRYVVTVEDVKRSRIPLAELVAYEIPAQTELLLNYPNPFNPETWIPYRLAKDAFVTLTIYDQRGHVVRDIAVGHRIAAVYESRSEAIYWDGRTEFGERVASGIYFYTLTAGDYSATRKMVILK